MLPDRPSSERIALNRVTFGARTADVDTVRRMGGFNAWVDDQLSPPAGDDDALAQYLKQQTLYIQYDAYDAMGIKWPAVSEMRPLQWLGESGTQIWTATKDELWKMSGAEQVRPQDELASSVYIRNTHSRYQLREVMTDFWLNHFSTSSAKDVQGANALIVYDRDVIRPNVFGNFRTMLEAVATSTSMLKYLDNADSDSVHPNENYARELMELHTMGRDAYLGKRTTSDATSGFTDEDIIQASRALSGWTVKQNQFDGFGGQHPSTGEFVFNVYQHNNQAGQYLGSDLSALRNIAQGQKVLDLVADHPATAAFVCGKIVKRIFGSAAPPAVLDRAVKAWNDNRTRPDQIKQVLRAILQDGTEVSTLPPSKVRRPHEMVIAFARAIQANVKPSPHWRYVFAGVYDAPFSWPTPDGRPDTDEFWLNSATTMGNWLNLNYLIGNVSVEVSYVDQMPLSIQNSPTMMAEFWLERLIGYSVNSQAMDALIKTMTRLRDGYAWDPKNYDNGIGFLLTALATSPEFMLR